MLLDECRLVSETASGRGASEWRDSEEKRRRAEIASGTQQDQGEAPRYSSSLIATVSHLTPSNSCRSAGPVPPLWKKGGGTPRDAWIEGHRGKRTKRSARRGRGRGMRRGRMKAQMRGTENL